MKLNTLKKLSDQLPNSNKMPVLFLGHGNPMNAIRENEFVSGFRNIGQKIPKPKAIVVISAHWETNGTFVTAMKKPKTIHDFGGFPDELFEVEYPAPGNPVLANEIHKNISYTNVGLDQSWGLDHGAWTVVKHLFPKADIPVIEFSLDYTKGPIFHYELAKELYYLRKKGILIIGSGNMVHNLGLVAWEKINEIYAYDWANEASEKIKKEILNKNHQSLIEYTNQSTALKLAIPTPEHFLPLLYVLALQDQSDQIEFFNDQPVAGSLTMTSLKLS